MCILLQEEKVDGSGDGSWKGVRYFSCKDGHAVFIVHNMLKPDRRQKKRSLVGRGRFSVHSLTYATLCRASGCFTCTTSCEMSCIQLLINLLRIAHKLFAYMVGLVVGF